MDWQIVQWILTALIGPAAIALWRWWERQQQEQESYSRKQSEDSREFTQQTQGDAFKQVLSLNQLLIENLVSLSNGRFDRQREELEKLSEYAKLANAQQSQLVELLRGVLREVSRTEEIFNDIDLELHKIEGLVSGRKTDT